MERTKKVETQIVDTRMRWKKTGNGSLRLGKRIIKPGEVFRANPEEIPESFRDIIVPLDSVEEKQVEPIKVKKATYSIQPIPVEESGDEEFFNIVNENGKRMNEKPLTEKKAKELIEDISK